MSKVNDLVRLFGSINGHSDGKSFSFQISGMAWIVIVVLIIAVATVLLAAPEINFSHGK